MSILDTIMDMLDETPVQAAAREADELQSKIAVEKYRTELADAKLASLQATKRLTDYEATLDKFPSPQWTKVMPEIPN